ncbi:PQQ-like beta-propeller repeat protein [Tahibacter harae]|uniref:PQQ-like beta-propeller repeat protein n=1 Tax=Tahibacter harae TaxID=2963937 RepID=A0ABT1QYW8_9GAMM|nr:PQQ-like beta-propeller repeat protein [Tahibacter harae]MCQ4167479.1 PQQ-like beta-propeller repeat protein [Tahibacter harae]
MIKPTAALALLAMCASSAASAWSWVRNTPAETTSPLLLWLAQTPDGTLWGADLENLHRRPPQGAPGSAYLPGNLQLAPGGEVLQQRVDNSGNYDLVWRDAQFRARWQLRRPIGLDSIVFKADGSSWISSASDLLRLDTHGRRNPATLPAGQQLTVPFLRRFQLAEGGDGVLLRSPVFNSDESLLLSLRDDLGLQRWEWNAGSQRPYMISRDPLTADGDILLVISEPAPPQRDRSVFIRLSGAGEQRWRQTLAQIPPTVGKAVWQQDGSIYLLYRNYAATPQQLLWAVAKLDRSGNLLWTRDAASVRQSLNPTLADLQVASNGTAIVLWSDDVERGLRQIGADGTVSAVLNLPFARIASSLLTTDGRLLASVTDSVDGPGRLVEIQQDGTSSTFSQEWPQRPATSAARAFHTLADGSSYVLSAADEYPALRRYSLSRYGADGSLLWTRPGEALLSPINSNLVADASRVCIGGGIQEGGGYRQRVDCFAAATGALLWSRPLQLTSANRDVFALRLLPDGKLVALYNRGAQAGPEEAIEHAVIDSSGALLSQRTLPGNMPPTRGGDIDSQGRATYVRWTPTGEYLDLTRLDADGSTRFTRTIEQLGLKPSRIQALDDGSALLSGLNAQGQWRVARLTASGSIAWIKPMDPACFTSFTVARNAIYGRCLISPPGDEVNAARISRLDPATGAVSWARDLSLFRPSVWNGSGLSLGVASDGRSLVVAQGWFTNKMRLFQLDAADGSVVRDEYRACEAEACLPLLVSMAPDAVARVLAIRADTAYGKASALYATPMPFPVPAPVRLDQPGITGAWWSPYANGEGIVLDWFPAQRTLFGAWFTYTTAGGNDPAQLRWYTIQAGNVAANATTVQLPILETTGGNFDAGPPASPVAIGTATLSFGDCDTATLAYAFDAGHNDGAKGTITLSRLTPVTESCILADGTTRPGAGAKPPQGGFDARMSGTWFEEATSGQGLQFTVQPGGVFFAPWFTYDLEGQGNDTNREHWFTLQGNLANATNGKAEVLIAQSLGGVFDRVPTYNGFAVGKATISMTACDKAKVDYLFDDTDLAGSFRKRSGTLELSKIGGCAP